MVTKSEDFKRQNSKLYDILLETLEVGQNYGLEARTIYLSVAYFDTYIASEKH